MTKLRNGGWALFAFALFMLWPRTASADIGLPMIFVVWPASWFAFIPVVMVEAAVAHRILRLSWRDASVLSLAANAWSTVVGIPLTWFALVVVEYVLSLGLYRSNLPDHSTARWIVAPFMAPWFMPTSNGWDVYAAGAVLCVPFYFASVRIEAWGARHRVSREDALRWAKVANLFTYVPITLALVVAAIVAWLRR